MNYFQNFGVNSARKLREFFAKACVNKAFLRKRLVGFIGGLHGNILRKREREQLHILKNRRENSVVAALVVFADIHSVQQDLALGRLVQPKEQLYERGFSCAVQAHDREPFSCVKSEREIFYRVILGFGVLERNVSKLELVFFRFGDRLSAVVAVTAVKVHKAAEIIHLTA